MADTKISELPANTTPGSTALVPVVESSTTSKSTLAQVARATNGWFTVDDGAAAQTGIGTTITQVLFNASTSEYNYLPHGISSSSVYDSGTSKVLFDWLNTGQLVLFQMNLDVTTNTTSVVVGVEVKVYNSSDVEVDSYIHDYQYPSADTYKVNFSTAIPITSSLSSGGYAKMWVTFSTGTGHSINPDGILLTVLA